MDKKDITDILNSPSYKEIIKKADKIRKENVGDVVHLRALIEFSNYCKMNCLYCGIRRENKTCRRYRLQAEDIIKYAKNAVDLGFKTIVLQSGEDEFYTTDKMATIIKAIKEYDVALTLGIGEKKINEYEAYKNAGADRFLLRIETTDEKLYKKMHPGASFKNRIECLKNLKKLGFETGTGIMVGLPNQSIESIANDILFFKEIDADMVGVGPFIPHISTPLGAENAGNFDLALKVTALSRILLPKANIPATTAMETIKPTGRILALQSGANVVMPNVLDYNINKNYEIYKNKASNKIGTRKTIEQIKSEITSIGRIIGCDKGFRAK